MGTVKQRCLKLDDSLNFWQPCPVILSVLSPDIANVHLQNSILPEA